MKTLAAFLAGGVAGAIAGAGAMLVAFPFLFPPPPADEPLPAPVAIERGVESPAGLTMAAIATPAPAAPVNRVAAGRFDETSPGRDAIHWANGAVGIYKQGERFVLRLESDFVAGPGPNFYIYLNSRKIGDEREFKADTQRIKLTQLRSFRGSQNYVLPEGIDLASIGSVTIWCERFSQFIANATI